MGGASVLVSGALLDGRTDRTAALVAARALPTTRTVIIVDHHGVTTAYYAVQAGTLARYLSRTNDADLGALARNNLTPAPVAHADGLADGDVAGMAANTIVVFRHHVLGVTMATTTDREVRDEHPYHHSPAPAVVTAGPRDHGDDADADADADAEEAESPPAASGAEPAAPGDEPAAPGDEPAASGAAPAPSPPPGLPMTASPVTDDGSEAFPAESWIGKSEDLGRFRGFPTASGPAEATSGQAFDLVVGFRTTPRPATVDLDTPIVLPGVGTRVEFEVQVTGFGFEFPDGVRHRLAVERRQPDRGSATVRVVPVEHAFATPRSLEVSYSYQGRVVGLAWHDLTVLPAGTSAPLFAPAPESTSGGTAMGTPAGQTPDLSVTIKVQPGANAVQWLTTTPHDVDEPKGPVSSTLARASGEAFAAAVMAVLPLKKEGSGVAATLRGIGDDVSNAVAPEIWGVIDQVWRRVKEQSPDRVPTLQLILDEPFVPWELATVVGGRQVGDDLASPDAGARRHLGQLWSVGRWLVARPQPRGDARPTSPPDATVQACSMAVVQGRYPPTITELPEAVAECEELKNAYAAELIAIDETAVEQLMDDKLVRDGAPFRPDIVHMAAHGQVSLAQAQFTGILLAGNQVLDAYRIKGSALGHASRPFVFLNACEVGAAASGLNGFGGLAEAFIVSGCRGFVAPLWRVDDDLARKISLGFYADVLDNKVPVGEAVRRIRADFTNGCSSATPLAYVFYGHPELRLVRE